MTKKNVLGYVAAFPIPEVIRGINAFTLGVRKINPASTVKVVWTNTWFDPQKERAGRRGAARQRRRRHRPAPGHARPAAGRRGARHVRRGL